MKTLINNNHTLEPVFSDTQIASKVKELAEKISKDYKGKNIVMVATLKGSFIFIADLARELSIPAHVDFVSVSSYIGTSTAGNVEFHYGPLHDISGKDVIIVEDIIDTGATIKCVVEALLQKGATDVKVCALLKRKTSRNDILLPDYLGFRLGDGFVVGYGLDCDEDYRNLKGLYKLEVKNENS